MFLTKYLPANKAVPDAHCVCAYTCDEVGKRTGDAIIAVFTGPGEAQRFERLLEMAAELYAETRHSAGYVMQCVKQVDQLRQTFEHA